MIKSIRIRCSFRHHIKQRDELAERKNLTFAKRNSVYIYIISSTGSGTAACVSLLLVEQATYKLAYFLALRLDVCRGEAVSLSVQVGERVTGAEVDYDVLGKHAQVGAWETGQKGSGSGCIKRSEGCGRSVGEGG